MKLPRPQFEQLALEQIDLLYRVARRLTRNADAAGDLVQETFLRALKGYRTFDLQSHGIRPWLVRIMHNLHFSRLARDKRQPFSLEEMPPKDSGADLLPLDIRDGMDDRLVGALDELPEEHKAVLLLWAVEEFSYKEIAESLEIPIGTVMSRLYRARQKMSEALRDFAAEGRIIRE